MGDIRGVPEKMQFIFNVTSNCFEKILGKGEDCIFSGTPCIVCYNIIINKSVSIYSGQKGESLNAFFEVKHLGHIPSYDSKQKHSIYNIDTHIFMGVCCTCIFL